MNVVTEFLMATGMPQGELAKLLKENVDPRFDQAMVSKMNQGLVEPNEATRRWLCEAMHRPSEASNDDLGISYRPPIETALKSEIYGDLVEALLRATEEYPATRSFLSKRLGVSDRAVRKMKEQAIHDGLIIGSSSHNKGYYICISRDQLRRVRAEVWSRTKSLLQTIRAIDRELSQMPGQVRMDDHGKIHSDGE